MKARKKPYTIAFGWNLREILKSRKITPEEVAAYGYIETKQVYRVMNAEHSPSIELVYSIAKGLSMHPKELFDFKYEETVWNNPLKTLAADEGTSTSIEKKIKPIKKDSGAKNDKAK